MIRRQRNAKIVATLGPASSSEDMIRNLFISGADVFRLNFSHGTPRDHEKTSQIIRQVSKELNRPIGILADLQGPKLRIGHFKDGDVLLKKDQRFIFDRSETPGTNERVHLPHKELFGCFQAGTIFLLNDGAIKLSIVATSQDSIETKVIVGGPLSDRKGLNIPGEALPISSLTEKDQEDLKHALSFGADWIGLSFVQKPEDIIEAKQHIGNNAKIASKIEKPQAIKYLPAIIELSDAIMVARGDLGVEIPLEDVPSIQKKIIRTCREAGKPVIVATQMLESMIHSPVPTRAETSDVATAVYDGVDAVMLSAESASGRYPVEAVQMMDRIITRIEKDVFYRQHLDQSRTIPYSTVSDSISAAARQIADIIDVKAIVTLTTSGSTTFRAARERPHSPIVAVTRNMKIAQALCLVWGVHPVVYHDINNLDEMICLGCHAAFDHGFATFGDHIIITGGIPFGIEGTTNLLKVAEIVNTDND